MMSPGDVRTFQQGKGSAVVIGLGLWAKKEGQWIQIHLTGPNDLHTTVTNNPDSVRFHKTLYRNLRRTLLDQGCWPYGDEGSEVGEDFVPVIPTEEPRPRFQPIRLRGDGPTASETVVLGRQESRF